MLLVYSIVQQTLILFPFVLSCIRSGCQVLVFTAKFFVLQLSHQKLVITIAINVSHFEYRSKQWTK